jgi:hypothetical protein
LLKRLSSGGVAHSIAGGRRAIVLALQHYHLRVFHLKIFRVGSCRADGNVQVGATPQTAVFLPGRTARQRRLTCYYWSSLKRVSLPLINLMPAIFR